MIDKIIQSLKGELSDKLRSDFGVPEDQVDESLSLGQKAIMETIKDEVGRGNFGGLFGILQEKEEAASNPIVTHMIRKYAGDLGAKLGMDPNLANTVASFAIPFILRKFQDLSKEQGIDLNSLMAMINTPEGGSDKMKGQFGDSMGGFLK